MERWKWVHGYKGYYKVSTYGRVKSVDRYVPHSVLPSKTQFVKGRIFKASPNEDGYPFVQLCNKRKIVGKPVHRLVAEAFIANPYNLPEVNHKDGDKTNNHVDNLEWCTHQGNEDHAVATGLKVRGLKHHNGRLTKAQVRTIRQSNYGPTRLGRKYGMTPQAIILIRKGKNYAWVK